MGDRAENPLITKVVVHAGTKSVAFATGTRVRRCRLSVQADKIFIPPEVAGEWLRRVPYRRQVAGSNLAVVWSILTSVLLSFLQFLQVDSRMEPSLSNTAWLDIL
jgi:hypothetical protein